MIIMIFPNADAQSVGDVWLSWERKAIPLFPCVLTSLTETLARVACSSDSGQIIRSPNTRNSHHGKLPSEYFISYLSAKTHLTSVMRLHQRKI